MSWLTKIENNLTITTGDSKVYRPLWKGARIITSYNISQFNFPNIPGTKVDRSAPKGNKYAVELYFQGEDHIEQAEAFRISANDRRPWTLSHPYYGDLLVQPPELEFNNDGYNSTVITGTLLETLSDTYPQNQIDAADKITTDKETTDDTTAAAYANNNPNPNTGDINQMNNTVDDLEATTPAIITSDTDSGNFKNKVNDARNAIINATIKPLQAMRAIQSTINFPFEVQTSIQNRINLLTDQFNTLLNTVISAPDNVPRSQKQFFESTGSTLISAMVISSSTPDDDQDYNNQQKVTAIIGTLVDNYNAYLSAIDTLLSDDTDEVDAYTPDFDSMLQLDDLVKFTVANLFSIAQGSKQERSIFLEEDSDVINVTHRFYGLDAEDENIQQLIDNNNIGNKEILTLPKGRRIVYYV